MKLEQITRMSGDMEADQKQIWRFLYQHIEKLNLLLDDFDRKVSAPVQSITIDDVTKVAEEISTEVSEEISRKIAEEVVNSSKTDQIIKTGTGSISYGTDVSNSTILFGYEFSSAPSVVISQPFSSKPVMLSTKRVTTNSFVVAVEGGFESSGTADFFWIAVGKQGGNDGT